MLCAAAPRVEACDPLELELFLLEKDNFDFTFIPAGLLTLPPNFLRSRPVFSAFPPAPGTFELLFAAPLSP
jgi:hypothetical protein